MADDGGDILVVVSKMKKYIKEKAGLNTSDAVAQVLSDRVRDLCDAAVAAAQADGRKTVLDRDVPGGTSPAGASPPAATAQ
jgi:histone H3/H4